MKTLTISIVLAVAGGTAYADQCEWVEPGVAAKAQQALANQPKVIAFCEPCGDKAPGVPEVASNVSLATPGAGYKEVWINGLGRDLAYTFVQTSPAHYQNLAKLAGCEATGVSPSLTVGDESRDGVLITASTTPVPTPPHAVETPVIRSLSVIEPTPAPPLQIVVVQIQQQLPWLAIVLAGVSGFAASLAGVIAFAAARRRKRAMHPRAMNLPLG